MNINADLIQFFLTIHKFLANPIEALCYHTLGYPKHGEGELYTIRRMVTPLKQATIHFLLVACGIRLNAGLL